MKIFFLGDDGLDHTIVLSRTGVLFDPRRRSNCSGCARTREEARRLAQSARCLRSGIEEAHADEPVQRKSHVATRRSPGTRRCRLRRLRLAEKSERSGYSHPAPSAQPETFAPTDLERGAGQFYRGSNFIDLKLVARDNRNLIGAVSRFVHQDGPRSCPKTIFGGSKRAKSLFRNLLHISTLNSKIWREFFPKSMIPKDR
jgi:hypothetical protein